MPNQLDIYWVDLNPTVGAETQKKRPCVILQSDLVNRGSRTFIVAPLLPDHKDWPFAVNIMPSHANGLDKPRHINVSQYACNEFKECLSKKNIRQSMSRKGDCWDNAVAESFFKTLKTELIYHRRFENRDIARLEIFRYIEGFYHAKRMHSALAYKTPNEKETLLKMKKYLAA